MGNTQGTATTAATLDFWGFLGKGIDALNTYKTNKMAVDLKRMEGEQILAGRMVNSTNPPVSTAGMDTLKDTFSNPVNLALLAVAGGLAFYLAVR